ncbi:MAG TPA: chloride channel protein [Terriglobales bacterium]|jgi:CIC family chloride channel protein|nr:chloride channel protein [Terriglobales bacterium]
MTEANNSATIVGSTGTDKTRLAVTGVNTADRPAPESAGFRMVTVSFLAAGVGLIAGCIAFLLYKLIGLFTNLAFYGHFSFNFVSPRYSLGHLGLWVIIIPVIGGIIVGVMAKYGSSKIKGHGIPEAMEAVLANRSRIEPRVAILKPISAAIAIGTGGPFGAEGPIIQTGGAVGSLIGQVMHTTAAERKVLLACGAAAGMSATFNTPIAGVILAIELLLFEFKARSFIPLVIASTLAAAVHMQLLGAGPMFTVAPMDFAIPRALPFYLLLGVICGLAAVGFTRVLYWVEDLFEKLPVDELWWPAIGALGLGIIGRFVPRVLGVGYDTIGDILNGNLALKILLVVMIAKAAALVISLGSGTSGGLLAPMFMSSAAMGGTLALGLNYLFPSAHISAGAFAIVAMGAVFGAASRATFSFIIFAFEITRDYNSVLPLMLVCVIADGISMLLMPKASIMTEKLRRRGMKINQDYEVDVLLHTVVSETMDHEAPTILASVSLSELADRIGSGDPQVSRHQGMLVLDGEGKLSGIITRGDVLRALEKNPSGTVLDACSRNVVVTYPDETLHEASEKMLRYNVGRLPVVDRADERRIVGYLGRPGIMAARRRKIDEEYVREPGWFKGFRRTAG